MNKFLIKKCSHLFIKSAIFSNIVNPLSEYPKETIEKPNPSFNLIDVAAKKCKWPGSYPPGFMF